MKDPHDLPAGTVFSRLRAKEILLIDVREPAEFANERIHGALLHPLSTFEPKAIPTDGSRQVVFQCGSGKRSRNALDQFIAETGADACHLAGGIAEWKTAGHPTIKINPATGQVEDHGKY
ncbi:rhodanese [Algimonas ampicilliniresistens]|uniref:Rhodanese n=1 Tax=Algimonas ampicilliniresistens TaxID=1298735 RepID=A0ABQ5V4Q9_9PROT|nr:rhodanese-like domain-containing protein [Algimonas ampicilliniresistens]GLQ22511.1 rhodanese [Algimonas ampicilliniresistens]